jgi:hypothetical protein
VGPGGQIDVGQIDGCGVIVSNAGAINRVKQRHFACYILNSLLGRELINGGQIPLRYCVATSRQLLGVERTQLSRAGELLTDADQRPARFSCAREPQAPAVGSPSRPRPRDKL